MKNKCDILRYEWRTWHRISSSEVQILKVISVPPPRGQSGDCKERTVIILRRSKEEKALAKNICRQLNEALRNGHHQGASNPYCG